MIETRDIVVEGRTYQVTQFSATKGIKMMTRLTKIIGEPIGFMFSNEGADVDQMLPMAIRALSDKLDEDMVLDTVKQLLEGVRNHEGELEFDQYFSGKMGLLFKILGKVLEVQYGDFFGGLIAKGFVHKKVAARPKK